MHSIKHWHYCTGITVQPVTSKTNAPQATDLVLCTNPKSTATSSCDTANAHAVSNTECQTCDAHPVVHTDVLAQRKVETSGIWSGFYQCLGCCNAAFALAEDDQGGKRKHALYIPPQVHACALLKAQSLSQYLLLQVC